MRAERQVLFWLAAAILLALCVLVLRDILLPFVAGLVIAYALNPIVDRLGMIGLPRVWGSAIVVAVVVLAIVAALVLLVPVLVSQGQQLMVTLPTELGRLKDLVEAYTKNHLGATYTDALNKAASELANNSGTIAGTIARSLWSQGLALVNLISFVLITPLVVFYLLVDWRPMLAKIDGWLPLAHAPTIRRLAYDIDAAIAAFIRGQGMVCFLLAMVYAVGLSWTGLKYGLLIGLVTGVISFVPFVGWALGLMSATGLAVVQFWPDMVPIWKVLAVFAFGMGLDSAVLSPRIVGSKIGLHPVWLLFALFVFSYLFGFVGVLVAVPLAAATAVLVRFALELYLHSGYYDQETAKAQVVSRDET
jgi:predicted PurR-regulated permease PerM